MATLPFSRRTVTLLIHILGWVLLGYLLFFSQWFNSEVQFPPLFWVRQAIFLSMMVGVFYLNTGWLVPRLLIRGQMGRYSLALLGILLVVLVLLGAFEFWFDLPTQMHRVFHHGGRGEIRRYGWIQPSVFTTTLVLAISTVWQWPKMAG